MVSDWWSQHFSPLIGIITNTKSSAESTASSANVSRHGDEDVDDSNHDEGSSSNYPKPSAPQKDGVQRYQFAATKLQLTGPVPSDLDVRYVAFRPLIKSFYTKSGIRGRLLNRALKHQYRTIYSYDRHTEYGVVDVGEHREHQSNLTRRFLEITDWGQGGRMYTYIITLDGEWRFTETGKEFGIQMLSKHTMHSGVSIYVAFAGEFFVRARKHRHHHQQEEEERHDHAQDQDQQPRLRPFLFHRHHQSRSSRSRSRGHIHHHARENHLEDFELVIDNDSGTYRPDKSLLPILEEFLSRNLPRMKVSAKHCFDEDHMEEKKEHTKAKEARGRARFKQPSSSRGSSSSLGSISSSDEEELTSGKIGIGRKVKRRMMMELEGSEYESGDENKEGEGEIMEQEREKKRKEKEEEEEKKEKEEEENEKKKKKDRNPEKKREKLKEKVKRKKEVAKEKRDEKTEAQKDESKDAERAKEYQKEEEEAEEQEEERS